MYVMSLAEELVNKSFSVSYNIYMCVVRPGIGLALEQYPIEFWHLDSMGFGHGHLFYLDPISFNSVG